MSSGYASVTVQTISPDTLSRVCKSEYDNFIKCCEDNDFDLSDIQFGDCIGSGVDKILSILCNKFTAVTGLNLYVGYHDSDNHGDCYDDIDGIYWEISNAFELTRDAIKFQQTFGEIETESFVTFG